MPPEVDVPRERRHRVPSYPTDMGFLHSLNTEETFDPEVDRVPAGQAVAPGGGPAPIPPVAPRRPRTGPSATTAPRDPVVVKAVDDGIGPRGRPCCTRRPTRDIRRPPWPRGDRAGFGLGARLPPTGLRQAEDIRVTRGSADASCLALSNFSCPPRTRNTRQYAA